MRTKDQGRTRRARITERYGMPFPTIYSKPCSAFRGPTHKPVDAATLPKFHATNPCERCGRRRGVWTLPCTGCRNVIGDHSTASARRTVGGVGALRRDGWTHAPERHTWFGTGHSPMSVIDEIRSLPDDRATRTVRPSLDGDATAEPRWVVTGCARILSARPKACSDRATLACLRYSRPAQWLRSQWTRGDLSPRRSTCSNRRSAFRESHPAPLPAPAPQAAHKSASPTGFGLSYANQSVSSHRQAGCVMARS